MGAVTITDQQKAQFAEGGYFVLENVIPAHFLELLRGECQAFIDRMNAEMDRQGAAAGPLLRSLLRGGPG